MNQKEDKFVEKRQFALPLETFVEIDISEEQRAKILKWIDEGDIIGIYPYATGLSRLVLINQTKLDKRKKRKKKQWKSRRGRPEPFPQFNYPYNPIIITLL